MRKKWLLKRQSIDNTLLTILLKKTNLPKEQLVYLSNRGLILDNQVKSFLNPVDDIDFKNYQDGNIVVNYLKNNHGKHVGIYADYDCDGVFASHLLKFCLEKLGNKVTIYNNNRFKVGYGYKKEGVDFLNSINVDYIIAVDLGITAIDEVKYAKGLGLETIVIDHHQPTELLPDAIAVVDPYRHDDKSKFKNYCTAALIYQLIVSIFGKQVEQLLGFVAIATLADVMEVNQANRYYIKKGLEIINTSNLIQYKVIRSTFKKRIDEDDLRFYVIPKFNAVGRLNENLDLLYNFLNTNNLEGANAYYRQIEMVNEERKKLTTSCYTKAITQINSEDKVNVIVGEFPEGIVGIIAGRILTLTGKPTFVLFENNEKYTGSIRSVASFPLKDNLDKVKQLILNYGGHDLAGGISIEKTKLLEFKNAINDLVDDSFISDDILYLDCIYNTENFDLNLIDSWDVLRPYGQGFEYPKFGLIVNNYSYQILKEKYLKINTGNIQIMAFNSLDYLDILEKKQPIKMVVKFDYDFKGNRQATLIEDEIRSLDDIV